MARTSGSADLLRQAILTSVPPEPSQYEDVQAKFVYVPPSHRRALEADAMVVAGIRGAGKSFWWGLLLNEDLRGLIMPTDVIVSAGFGSRPDEAWPDKDEIRQMLECGVRPEQVWKSVVLRIFAPPNEDMTWLQWARSVQGEPSVAARALRDANSLLASSGTKHLVVFDALDRTADSPEQRRDLLRGLLQLVLELRAYSSLRAKVFVRPDMLEDPRVTSFPDASKVVASRVSLDWTPVDLYALLFTYLGNADSKGASLAFRELLVESGREAAVAVGGEGHWSVPPKLRISATSQEKAFMRLAGQWMGTDRRRGKTYTWVPNHLADAHAKVSPRSFLAAIRAAAEATPEEGQRHALHWRGLQQGVRKASEYRVTEIQEDLPWAHEAMGALQGLVVPCKRLEIEKRWRSNLLAKLVSKGAVPSDRGVDELVEQLRSAGILEIRPDGRINIPDVYRVGFKLRRKGGFLPASGAGRT